MSTVASATIEEVANASDAGTGDGYGKGARWFQLYWPQDDAFTLSLLRRAKDAGFEVLVVTLDTWALGWRPWDLDTGYVPSVKGIGVATAFSDPVFRKRFAQKYGRNEEEMGRRLPVHAGANLRDTDVMEAAMEFQRDVFSGTAHTWDQVRLLRDNWEGPIVLKGIQHPEDALNALEVGADGIVVSNHGGRQMDGAIGSLDMLPEIVDRVKGRKTRKGDDLVVLFDSGIRTGADIIKALCLGAQAVLIGRPWVYGLGIAGKEGMREVIKGILADLDQSMGLCGIGTIGNCQRDVLRKVHYPGDQHSSN
ncbi:MAG: hypothetical protein Q9165_008574 [Trypethelium subeluteriae]